MKQNQISDILQQMTLEEKAELCSGADFWHTKAVERLGVPALTISDGPSGLRKQEGSGSMGLHESSQSISFPSGSLAASSFDRALLRKLGETLGEECRAEEIDILLGPSMNIKRSPLCGRNFEYYSEDPYVSGELAGAYVDGLQEKGVGACPKHFYGNNMEERRMSTSSEMTERTAREIYLPAFERMVTEHQPHTIMCSYNKINGVYAAENKEALTDILREEWGFEGSAISDWGAVNDRAKDLDAGLDLEMPSSHGAGPKAILKAIEEGSLSEEKLDLACERLLRTIAKSRTADRTEADRTAADTKPAAGGAYHWEKDHETAKQIARESMVLLKNDGTLPLSEKQNVVFIGPFAKAPRYQGGGSAHVQPWKVESAWDAVKDRGTVTYMQGVSEEAASDEAKESSAALLLEAAEAAAKADAAVLFVGIPEGGESEGFDRSDLKLPAEQTALIEAVAKVQPQTVVVLHNGAPVEMPWINQVGAVLESYLGGEAVGAAQAELLFGKANPCGHLAETFPLKLEDTLSYLNFRPEQGKVTYREGVFVGYRYYDTVKRPVLFPFGHGLSYTTFAYSDLRLDRTQMTEEETLTISVTVTNTGSMAGKEVVQLYVSPAAAEVARPEKELRGFEKIGLEPGESKTVTFYLKERDLAYWDEELHDWYAPSGEYRILIGRSSADIRAEQTFTLKTKEKKRRITKDTAIGDLSPEQIRKVMEPFAKRSGGSAGDHTVSDKASQALMLNMPLRSLVAFGAMDEEGLLKILEELDNM